mgnify:CR=1 FL=1
MPLTWTSSVFVEPNQFASQTSSISRSRVTTAPAFAHQQREQVELLARQLERRAPSSVAACASRVEPHAADLERPILSAPAERAARRSTARMRAITSRALNGLTT